MDTTPSGFNRQKRPIDAAGSVVDGRYRIEALLGSGGMSTVYRAKHLQLGRDVALKMLRTDAPAEARLLERIIQEARAESSLKHPNVLGAQALGINDQHQVYLVTDYLPGQSLAAILRKRSVPQQIACKVFLQICDGLAHAHASGVIHRDLKPSNVMILNGIEDPLVKIVDFGIAKLTNAEKSKPQNLTQAGTLIGSPAYMSPEQCVAMDLDARSDIYSLGCLMFETLTGRLPFVADTEYGILDKQINAPPPTFAEINPHTRLSPDLEAIVHRCLNKEREKRFSTCTELKEALQQADLSLPYKAPKQTAAGLKNQRFPKIKTIAVCLLAASASAAVLAHDAVNQFVHASVILPFLEKQVADNQKQYGNYCAPTVDSQVALADEYEFTHQPGKAALIYGAALPNIAFGSPATKHRIVDILSGTFGGNEDGICLASRQVAAALDLRRDTADAQAALEFAGYRMRHAHVESRVAVLNALADLLVLHGRPADGVKVSSDSLWLAKSIKDNGRGNGRNGAIGNLFMTLGDEYALLQDGKSAIHCYQQAVDILPGGTPALQQVKQRARARLDQLLRQHP